MAMVVIFLPEVSEQRIAVGETVFDCFKQFGDVDRYAEIGVANTGTAETVYLWEGNGHWGVASTVPEQVLPSEKVATDMEMSVDHSTLKWVETYPE